MPRVKRNQGVGSGRGQKRLSMAAPAVVVGGTLYIGDETRSAAEDRFGVHDGAGAILRVRVSVDARPGDRQERISAQHHVSNGPAREGTWEQFLGREQQNVTDLVEARRRWLVDVHFAGLGALHHEYQRHHHQGADTQQPEGVNVGQHGGLALQSCD